MANTSPWLQLKVSIANSHGFLGIKKFYLFTVFTCGGGCHFEHTLQTGKNMGMFSPFYALPALPLVSKVLTSFILQTLQGPPLVQLNHFPCFSFSITLSSPTPGNIEPSTPAKQGPFAIAELKRAVSLPCTRDGQRLMLLGTQGEPEPDVETEHSEAKVDDFNDNSDDHNFQGNRDHNTGMSWALDTQGSPNVPAPSYSESPLLVSVPCSSFLNPTLC
ncbi:hypothetical protein EI94DRAFT_1702907 [Lactarius quietus]|nr:hypothetical protein EI94DRAFT_1702907 [Lactarius quietus]